MAGMAAPDDDDHEAGHAGHRARLRQRFLTAGAEALADYELLELLLFLSKPRGDVKPLAKRLIARFGSFAEVVSAPPEALARVERSEEHTSELQSLMRNSYAVFCWKKTTQRRK